MAAPALTRGAKGTVRPAGVKNYGADDSAAAALDFGGRPSTPERLRRFRVPAEPGVRVRPAGPMRDDKVDDTQFFGQVKPKDVPAAQAMDNSMTPLQEYEAVSSFPRSGRPSSSSSSSSSTGAALLAAQVLRQWVGTVWSEGVTSCSRALEC